jgi:hypothetical protein
MTQKAAPPTGELASNVSFQLPQGATQEGRSGSATAGPATRASREGVVAHSAWIRPLQEEMGRIIVGQKHLLDRLLIALLTNGHVLLEGVPGLAKTLALKTCLSHQTWANFQQSHPRGRNQPGAREGPERTAGSDARAPGNDRG